MGKYAKEIDERDLRRIIDKEDDLKQVVVWLNKLAELDAEVATDKKFKPIMKYLNKKISVLHTKRELAEEEMQHIVDMIAMVNLEEEA